MAHVDVLKLDIRLGRGSMGACGGRGQDRAMWRLEGGERHVEGEGGGWLTANDNGPRMHLFMITSIAAELRSAKPFSDLH